MEIPTPQNPDEAAYISIAILDALLMLLVKNGIIVNSEVSSLIAVAAERLKNTVNGDAKRAATFLAERKTSGK